LTKFDQVKVWIFKKWHFDSSIWSPKWFQL
jgi:hypothetical protein